MTGTSTLETISKLIDNYFFKMEYERSIEGHRKRIPRQQGPFLFNHQIYFNCGLYIAVHNLNQLDL